MPADPTRTADEERFALFEAGAEAAMRQDWEREQFERALKEEFDAG